MITEYDFKYNTDKKSSRYLITTPWRRVGNRSITPRIRSLCVLYGSEWWAYCSDSFTHLERAPDTHWIGGWVSPRAGLDAEAKRIVLSPTGNQSQTVHPLDSYCIVTDLSRLL
jgi:hypothetical protein